MSIIINCQTFLRLDQIVVSTYSIGVLHGGIVKAV